jgi:hypothetical protein
MLPNSDTHPTGFNESQIGVTVSLDVPGDLLRPKIGIGDCDTVMLGTSVPETPIQEHGNPHLGKYEVRCST